MVYKNAPQTALLSILAGLLLIPSAASASPWLVEPDELSLGLNYDFQYAQREFLPDGQAQVFPLNGAFSGNRFSLSGRYGISASFEAYTSLAFKQVSYMSDPVVLALPDEPTNQVAVNESIIDFNDSIAGVGDLRLGARYQFANLDGIFVMASDTELKLPTGYDKPSGTFEEDTPAPGNIQDDVTLGDGQTETVELSLR